jgi:hypothetical protein
MTARMKGGKSRAAVGVAAGFLKLSKAILEGLRN